MDDQPPPRRRWLRRLLVYAAVAAVLVVVVVGFAPVVIAKTGLRQTVLDAALADLNGRVTAADAQFVWLGPVVLRGVTVTDPAGTTVLTADRVATSKTLWQLYQDRSDLGTVTVTKPVAHVVCEPGTTNVEKLLAKYLKDDGTPPAPTRPAVRVEVQGGKLVQTEPNAPGESVLDPVDAVVVVPAGRDEPVTLEVKATAGGTMAVAASLGSPVSGKLTADQFPLDAVGPLTRRFARGTRAAGTLTADLSGAAGPAPTAHGLAKVTALSLEAPWLGPDRLRLGFAELPLDVTLVGNELEVRKAELTCDVGKASATGRLPLDATAEEYAGRAGLTAAAELDLAKLADIAPRLLRLRPGTALSEGTLSATLKSSTAPTGVKWEGGLTTTAVKGTRDGKALDWPQPLTVEFVGHLATDGQPVFDKLQARSEFAAVAAQGTATEFAVAANIDLDRLLARISQFADLSGTKLAGRAEVQANVKRAKGGRFALAGKADLKQITVADAAGHGLTEPEATVTVQASGVRPIGGTLRLEVAEVTAQAAGDSLAVHLPEPAADWKAARATATVRGDAGRWAKRLSTVVALPAGWQVGGSGSVSATVARTAAGAAATGADLKLTNAKFRGAGVELDEPTLTGKAASVTWDRATGAMVVADANLECPTVTLSTQTLNVSPAVGGEVKVAGDLARLSAPLKLSTPLAGRLTGPVALDPKDPGGFAADLRVDNFVYGRASKPTWKEPWVTLRAGGRYAADAVRFTTLVLERDGAKAEATGSLATLSGTPTADLTGTLSYELAKLEPQLRDLLGTGVQVAGSGKKPFRLAGPLGGSLEQLAGDATVGWQTLKGYGLDVGPGELKATLDRGRLGLSPVTAGFGGGTVRLDPAVDLQAPGTPLTLAAGTAVDHAKLSPQATAGALGYALPAVANAAQADGTVSLKLDDARVPLAAPTLAVVRGKLVLHDAHLTAGPVFAEVLHHLEASTTAVTLAKEQVVPVAVDKGRVYHDNFALTFGQTVVKSKGSVGLADQSLNLEVEMPIPPRLIDGPLQKNPIVRDALKNQTIRLPMAGTLKQPRLDNRALATAVERAVKDAGRDVGRGAFQGLAEKGLGELNKKLAPPKKK